MHILKKYDLPLASLPGRGVRTAVGKNAFSPSTRMTFGWSRFAAEFGPMEPHHHAEEIVAVLSAEKAYFRHGPSKDELGERIPFETNMAVHFAPLEWHVFEYDEGGHLELLWFYGQVDNLRPEEIQAAAEADK